MDLKLNLRLLGLFCVLLMQGASAAAPCNKMCTFEYDPVCGSDYNTYATLCVLEAEQCDRPSTLSMLYKGECICNTNPKCTKELQPHCGSDGVTYNNQCLFNFAKICSPELKLKNLGKCTSSGVDTAKCNTLCTAEYNPVCGSDYKTYATRCVLEAHRCRSGSALSTIYDGECTCDKKPVCTEENQPHCGSDGKTYDNKCNFNFAQLCSPDLKLSKMGLCASMYASGAATQLTLGLLSTTILMVVALFI